MLRNHRKPMKKFILLFTHLGKNRVELYSDTQWKHPEISMCRGGKLPRMSMFSGDRNLKGNTLFNLGKNITAYVWYPSRISALILRVWNTARPSCKKKDCKILILYHSSYRSVKKIFTRTCLWDNEQLLKYINTSSKSQNFKDLWNSTHGHSTWQ